MIETTSLLDELEDAIAVGTHERRVLVLRRVTDLFMTGSGRYSPDQIDVFDDVMVRLTAEIEERARVMLARDLAHLPDAPRRIIRLLADDDAVDVAAPVLIASPQLSDDDLVTTARTKSQGHLAAISQRTQLSEAVTDVLVDRGDAAVVRLVASNHGARFSEFGFGTLVARAHGDDELTHTVGMRHDTPRQHLLKLLDNASAAVRAKLAAANPRAAAAINATVADVANAMRKEIREGSPAHLRAKKEAKKRYKIRPPTESDVHAYACSQNFEKTLLALATCARFPIDLVERALIDENIDMVLILGRAAGFSRTTVKAILQMKVAGRGLSEADLEAALQSFDRLNAPTAESVLKFYEKRSRARAEQPAPQPAARPAVA